MATAQSPRLQRNCCAEYFPLKVWVGGRKKGAGRSVWSSSFNCVEMRHFLRYILDLNKEQEASFVERVVAIAQKAEFEPWTEGKPDGVHTVFVPRRE